jgi:AP-2 complex subunit alpha
MHENSDFLRLVVNSIRKDLHGNNEIDNCLALHAIANVGGSEMAEALAEDVHRLLISPSVFIRWGVRTPLFIFDSEPPRVL